MRKHLRKHASKTYIEFVKKDLKTSNILVKHVNVHTCFRDWTVQLTAHFVYTFVLASLSFTCLLHHLLTLSFRARWIKYVCYFQITPTTTVTSPSSSNIRSPGQSPSHLDSLLGLSRSSVSPAMPDINVSQWECRRSPGMLCKCTVLSFLAVSLKENQ